MPETEKGAKKEKSAGAIIYCMDEKEPRFLLLKYKTYWGFAKGIIEPEESIEQAAKREIREETGLDNLEFITGFRHIQKWFFRAEGRLVSKDAVFLLAKVTAEEAKKVKISFEHEGFKWLGYEEAVCLMKIKNNRDMIKSAYDFVKEHEKQKKIV